MTAGDEKRIEKCVVEMGKGRTNEKPEPQDAEAQRGTEVSKASSAERLAENRQVTASRRPKNPYRQYFR